MCYIEVHTNRPNRPNLVGHGRSLLFVNDVCLLLNGNGVSARALCGCVLWVCHELRHDKGERSGAFVLRDALESLGLECGEGGLVDGLGLCLGLFLGVEPLRLGVVLFRNGLQFRGAEVKHLFWQQVCEVPCTIVCEGSACAVLFCPIRVERIIVDGCAHDEQMMAGAGRAYILGGMVYCSLYSNSFTLFTQFHFIHTVKSKQLCAITNRLY